MVAQNHSAFFGKLFFFHPAAKLQKFIDSEDHPQNCSYDPVSHFVHHTTSSIGFTAPIAYHKNPKNARIL
jgi:hypothetical protein